MDQRPKAKKQEPGAERRMGHLSGLSATSNRSGGAMMNVSLAAAILLVSFDPFSVPAQEPVTSQSASIEGCLSSNVDDFFLTTVNGKGYPLGGDTNLLAARVGHTVRVWGQPVSGDAEKINGGVQQVSFEVQKVQSLSASCK
jgi:hypothetical protein